MDDPEALVVASRRGDRSAFEALVRRYERPLLALFAGICPSAEVVEELVQETFVRAFFALSTLRSAASFGPWVHGIAHNVFRDWAKDRKRRSAPPTPEARERTEVIERRLLLHQQVYRIVQGLPEPYRELVSIRYYGGRSCQEIAAELGRPLGTVTKQLSRAHALVARELRHLRGFTTLLHFMLPKDEPHER